MGSAPIVEKTQLMDSRYMTVGIHLVYARLAIADPAMGPVKIVS